MHALKVKIPFWYKPFIRFMPDFWDHLPEEKIANWKTAIIVIPLYYRHTYYLKPEFKSLQKAYLYIRWKTMWKDFKGSLFDYGIEWQITRNDENTK